MKPYLFIILTFFLGGCTTSSLSLAKVHLTTQQGLTQTLTAKERLKPYEKDSFIIHQPHQKVVRVYESSFETKKVITTYYPSGQIYQLLECQNNQACGAYKEWHKNGTQKVKASLIGGAPQIEEEGFSTWIFDGLSEAYDEQGHLIASFYYQQGLLDGEGFLYHSNGEIKEKAFYLSGKKQGLYYKYDQQGVCIEKSNYQNGHLDGKSTTYWSKKCLASEEQYSLGLLKRGLYFNPVGKLQGQVKEGCGNKIVWNSDKSFNSIEHQNGAPEGEILCYDSQGKLFHKYCEVKGLKTKEEILYYEGTEIPKLSIHWSNGQMHGPIKSWYPNGVLESQREMSQNKKTGFLKAQYEDGNLMLIENYDQDLLKKGQYYKKGSSVPCSRVEAGEGIATLFDSKGTLLHKVRYQGGRPIE